LADWYVYQHDGEPLGPLSTDAIADAILVGSLPPDVWVAAPGGPRWLRALDVPVIGKLVEGVPTRPRRRDSGLRLTPPALVLERAHADPPEPLPCSAGSAGSAAAPSTTRGTPDDTARMAPLSRDLFGAWKEGYDRALAAEAAADAAPSTTPAMPPSSTPTPPDLANEAPHRKRA
jgi:hypothetical protein